jgi:hypothetical protein
LTTTINLPVFSEPMPRYYVRETFFRPQELAREHSALPASLYNDLQLVLKRSGSENLFIPIRSMQYQAVVEGAEIIFVDSQGGYAHQDGEGGRLIRVAWRPAPAAERESLTDPVPCEIVYYFPGLKEIQWRLMSEFPPVLVQILQRQREKSVRAGERRVLPLRRDP